jgi:hypothetical protein
MSYSGANSELLSLAGQSSVTDTIDLSFSPIETLVDLTDGGERASFTCSIIDIPALQVALGSMVPEGDTTAAILGGAMVALGRGGVGSAHKFFAPFVFESQGRCPAFSLFRATCWNLQ